MKKALMSVTLFALLVAPAAVFADDHMNVSVETWTRAEYLENFTDANDDIRDNLDFMSYRARINLNVQASEDMGATFELQNYGVWGDTLLTTPPASPGFPTTANGFGNTVTSSTNLYQGFISLDNIGGSSLSVTVGRQEHTLGNELHMGDNSYYGGQSYDGLRGNIDFESWDLDFWAYKVAERDDGLHSLVQGSFGGSDDADLYGVSADFELADGHELEPYIIYSRENNEFGDGVNFVEQHSAYTLGALYEGGQEDGMFDWSIELALQSGDVGTGAGEADLSSNVFEGNFGIKFGEGHRVGIGVLRLGDGDDPQDVEAFMEIFPDTHGRAGRMDLFSSGVGSAGTAFGFDSFHNLTNIFVDWEYNSGNNTFGAAFHNFAATEDFGGEDDLGSEIDLWWEHASGEHVSFALNVGTFQPGDAFTAPFDDDIMRATAMLRFRQ